MTNDEASATEGHGLARELFRLANLVKPDQPIMVMIEQKKLLTLAACYERAMLDPNVRLPSYLHGAIEALKL